DRNPVCRKLQTPHGIRECSTHNGTLPTGGPKACTKSLNFSKSQRSQESGSDLARGANNSNPSPWPYAPSGKDQPNKETEISLAWLRTQQSHASVTRTS
ncbi:hypothetical protein BaRGS_00030038, partial [Batillaria attramentaria]